MRRFLGIVCLSALFSCNSNAQLKFIVEDFEGFSNGIADLHKNGVFDYGNIKASVQTDKNNSGSSPFYTEERCLAVKKEGKQDFGGWGKGVSLNVELDADKDRLNFYLRSLQSSTFKITLQEDDDHSNAFEKEKDDSWVYERSHQSGSQWELISVPLNEFKDENTGGDGIFNCNYREGKLLCFIITFPKNNSPTETVWFDFICFSEGELTQPSKSDDKFCSLGLWSEEGNKADFYGIATTFEKLFSAGKKTAVIHFFQPFYSHDSNINTSVESIEKLISNGYVPMITLEDRYATKGAGPQPNLYSITEGYYDFFFTQWAKRVRGLKSIVLVRILHEFNGDWYPWCIINNDRNPEMLIKAFRHIRDIFKKENADNAKFIWCPNSMSVPQESWNYILKAYPGDEYVDLVGLDIYNGSAVGSGNWRSFRKEAIENYFLLTKNFPDKPFIVCETASRERKDYENGDQQNKEEWIKQMSNAIQNDLSKIKLLCWFNEKEYFKFSSSPASLKAYLNYVIKNSYFRSGSIELLDLLK